MDNISWHKGEHAFKFGMDFTSQRNSVGGVPPGGVKFSIDGYATVASVSSKRPSNLTGTAEALLGYVNTLTTYQYGDKTRLYQHAWSAFATDEWRITKKLSLSLGLRYEYTPNWNTGGNLTSNFDLNSGKILVPNTTMSYLQNVVGLPNAALPPNYRYVSPSSVHAHNDSVDLAPPRRICLFAHPTIGSACELRLLLRAANSAWSQQQHGFSLQPPGTDHRQHGDSSSCGKWLSRRGNLHHTCLQRHRAC
ncbi:MAG TPA: hypothetical protein VK638_34385 [Edaphobacter sp.]|nr:hypothetical protein [Edaphobacter sp.]